MRNSRSSSSYASRCASIATVGRPQAGRLAVYAVYGNFSINLNVGPGLMLWVLWTLVASVVLYRRTRGEQARVGRTNPAAAS